MDGPKVESFHQKLVKQLKESVDTTVLDSLHPAHTVFQRKVSELTYESDVFLEDLRFSSSALVQEGRTFS